MEMDKKNLNIQIGNRLREARRNMNIDKTEIAQVLNAANSSKEQRDQFFERILAYVVKLIKK